MIYSSDKTLWPIFFLENYNCDVSSTHGNVLPAALGPDCRGRALWSLVGLAVELRVKNELCTYGIQVIEVC